MNDENEIWKDIPGYEGLYRISSLGKVFSLDRIAPSGKTIASRFLKIHPNHKGYLAVSLNKKPSRGQKFAVHRLVAFAFLNNTDNKPQINHKDGNKKNNNVENLEW